MYICIHTYTHVCICIYICIYGYSIIKSFLQCFTIVAIGSTRGRKPKLLFEATLELLIGLLQEDHAKQSGNPRQRPSQRARQALQRTSAQTSLHNGYGWQFKLERMASSHAHTKLATREWLWMSCLMLREHQKGNPEERNLCQSLSKQTSKGLQSYCWWMESHDKSCQESEAAYKDSEPPERVSSCRWYSHKWCWKRSCQVQALVQGKMEHGENS